MPENTTQPSNSVSNALMRTPVSDVPPLPADFICPLSGQVMSDPVVDADGHVFDRVAITMHLQSHKHSPLNKHRRMTVAELKPVCALFTL